MLCPLLMGEAKAATLLDLTARVNVKANVSCGKRTDFMNPKRRVEINSPNVFRVSNQHQRSLTLKNMQTNVFSHHNWHQ